MFIGRTDAKAETPVLWPPHAKSWLIGKDPDVGRDWGQEEKGMTEDEMAGWHHRLDGHEFEWTLGVGDGQGGLACCSSCGCKESDTTEWLNWTELNECLPGFPGGSVVKNPPSVQEMWVWPLERSPRGGNGNPLQYSCMGSPMDRSLAGYSLWGHKRISYDLETEQQEQQIIIWKSSFQMCYLLLGM